MLVGKAGLSWRFVDRNDAIKLQMRFPQVYIVYVVQATSSSRSRMNGESTNGMLEPRLLGWTIATIYMLPSGEAKHSMSITSNTEQ